MTSPRVALVHLHLHAHGAVWVVEQCPYCGERHVHGGGGPNEDPRRFLGHRVPHCDLQKLPVGVNPSPGYVLREASA